MTNNRVNNRF